MLLCLIKLLWYVKPYMLYVFTSELFITSGKRIRIMILLHCIISTSDMITSLGMKLDLYLHAALWSFPYLGCYLSEFTNNHIHSMGKTGGDTFPTVSPLLSSSACS